jgi:hypothetical protein
VKPVFSDREPASVGLFYSTLEAAGIPCFIRNQNTNTTMAEMPSGLFFPVLCVMNDEDFDRAKALIIEIRDGSSQDGPDWICSACDEGVPYGFEICWNCGAEPLAKEA